MPENDYIEQVPIQRESTAIKKPLLDTGQRKIKVKEDKQAMEIAHQILSDARAKSNRTANGRVNTDYPLQVEHPELWVIPAVAEIKAAGLVPGMFRFAAGTVTGNEIGKQSTNIGQKIDNKLGTRVFAPTFGFVGGLGGYAFGSGFMGNMLSRIPRKYSYGPTNERTYWAEDQTPKYNSSQITGHFGKVKYYGPTMGKTTAVASNPKLVDFDDIIRQPSRTILDRYGFRNKSEMYNSGNREAIKAYEDMLVKTLRDWRANPENSNLTLVASPTAIANPSNTGFYFDNVPSIPSRDVFITRNIGRGGTPEASALWYDSLIEQNPNLKIDDRFVSQIESKPYQSPSTKILDPQSDGDALRPFVLGRKPMYSVITKGYGHDAKVIEEADFAIGPDVIKLDYTRPITGLHGETYQQGMRFYVNPNKLKEVIGQFQDLYKARLYLPEHWNTNQIYNYIIQHPEKVDVKLGETPQDIVGLNLGFGIKDAMLFADGKLEDFGGVYKRTVPNWYAMLKKRLDSGNLKRDHGTFNGNHVTWKFNWGVMDDWARKQAPKMPLPE